MTAISRKSLFRGRWTDPNASSTGTVPAAGDDATIGVAGGYTVSLTTPVTVNSITISNNGKTLAIAEHGGTVGVRGGFANSGAVLVDNGGTGTTSLTISGTLTDSNFLQIGNSGIVSAMNELSDVITADGQGIAAVNSPYRVWAVPRRLEQAALITVQLLGLCALNHAGIWFVKRTGLPVPGNLIGMVALCTLLALGVVKVAWFDLTGSFLIKHLAFFFIPITVGLMNAPWRGSGGSPDPRARRDRTGDHEAAARAGLRPSHPAGHSNERASQDHFVSIAPRSRQSNKLAIRCSSCSCGSSTSRSSKKCTRSSPKAGLRQSPPQCPARARSCRALGRGRPSGSCRC